MEKTQITQIMEIIETLFNFLYTQNKKYIVSIKWFDENTNIKIKGQFGQSQILDLNINGKIDTYQAIVKNINELVINNNDTFGCLTTSDVHNSRKVEAQNIRTKNLEIMLPIYSRFGLVNAEAYNNLMLDKLNNSIQEQKILCKIKQPIE